MRKFLVKFTFSFLLVAGLLLCSYFFLVYPNDSRVPELPAQAVGDHRDFVGSVLKSRLTHSIDIDFAEYRQKLTEVDRLIDVGFLRDSRRFTSKYQVLAPLGFYPWRLEAFDSLAVPSGKTLTVIVPPGAQWVEFSIRSGLEINIKVMGLEGGPKDIHLESKSSEIQLPAFLRKPIRKYLYINQYVSIPRWESYGFRLAAGTQLQMTCVSKDQWCFVGDPTFYRAKTDQGSRPRQTIMVMIDTLRADAVNPKVMPRLSRFANEAHHFVNALSPGNMTSPSTNGVLACRTPTDLGRVAFAYTVGAEFREQFYQSSTPSFASILREHGITTAMIGNISVVSEVFGVGVSHGFEQQILVEPEGYETPLAISEAIKWLQEHRNEDFFLYIHLNNPHAPYKPPLKYLSQQFRGLNNLTTYPSVVRWLYRGEAAFADFQVGRLIDFLNKSELSDQVNMVVTSDHGDQHTERVFSGNDIGSDFSGVYFDHGATLLNDEIHVPLIIKTAGSSPRQVQEFVSSLWIGKTLLKMNGLTAEELERCVGQDLVQFPSMEMRQNPEQYPLIGSEGFQARTVLVHNRYKYIKTYEPTEKRVYANDRYSGERKSFLKHEQLFDLALDPAESKDLLATRPDLLDLTRQAFRNYFSINSRFELVLEASGRATYTINASSASDGSIQRVSFSGKQNFSGEFEGQVRLPFEYVPGMKLPKVSINDALIPLKVSTLKLPPPDNLMQLPEESMAWARPVRGPSAFIVRVVDERREDRKISLGNPAFEGVLREWGYLNEN